LRAVACPFFGISKGRNRIVTSSVDEAFRQALGAMQAGRVVDAERLFKQVLQAQPRHVPALNLIGILLSSLRRFDEADRYVRMALSEDQSSATAFHNHGLILTAQNRPDEAFEQFSRALHINATVAETWNGRGAVLNGLERYREAVGDFDRALAINANYPDALSNKGEALAKLNRYDDALLAYGQALAARPDLAKAWLGRGNVLVKLSQYQQAFAAFDKAIALRPAMAEAWFGRGNVFVGLKQFDNALEAYDKALTFDADLAEIWLGRCRIFAERGRYADALAVADRAIALKPNLRYVAGDRIYLKQNIADWDNFSNDVAALLSAVAAGKPASAPFQLLAISSSPAIQLQCAQTFVADQPSFSPLWRGEIYRHQRIKVAYLSADFRDHPVAQLMAGLFEQHDKTHFEPTAISFGPDDGSAVRRRIESAFEQFTDAQHLNDLEVAEFIRRNEIDIAVDLMGFTTDSRLNVFTRRAAPIQVGYLGYAGTMGGDFIDYILADPTVIPEDQCRYYSETVIWLPESYQVNDGARPISAATTTRNECGLPERAFVFCCFNNTFKITPAVFDVWMRLLKAAEGSVLWLRVPNEAASANLRREAEMRGIAGDRLIFAKRTPLAADHLARHRLADLFLDTTPFNAHTTANDALYAGLPVLTCVGQSFASRVAASLLKAVGLGELITNSLEEYEALALRLIKDPSHLASVREKLARNRRSAALFDTAHFTRRLEAAYTMMWERYQRGDASKLDTGKPIRVS
jgi:protein O-GlcNAc transferase